MSILNGVVYLAQKQCSACFDNKIIKETHTYITKINELSTINANPNADREVIDAKMQHDIFRTYNQAAKTPKSPANQVKLRMVIVTMPMANFRACLSISERAPLHVAQLNSGIDQLIFEGYSGLGDIPFNGVYGLGTYIPNLN